MLRDHPATLVASFDGPVALSIARVTAGRVDALAAHGRPDPAGTGTVTTETVFQVASLSKVVTAIGVLRLVQAGALDLDRDVNATLPPGSAVGTSSNAVTLRQLLTHSAGVGLVRGWGDVVRPWRVASGPSPTGSGGRTDTGMTSRLLGVPGSAWSYGNHSHGLVQRVVEAATGMCFAAAIVDDVFAPLGMEHSSFSPGPGQGVAAARGCRRRGTDVRWCRPRAFLPLAAGGLWTTARDLAALAARLLADDAGFLDSELRRELFRCQDVAGVTNPFTTLTLRAPPAPAVAGWYHGGWWWGTYSVLALDPDTGDAAVILATGQPATSLLQPRAVPAPRRPRPRGDAAPDQDQIVGVYRTPGHWLLALGAWLAFGSELCVRRGGGVLTVSGRWGPLRGGRLLRRAPDGTFTARTRSTDIRLAFAPGPAGMVCIVLTPMCVLLRTDARRSWRRRLTGWVLRRVEDGLQLVATLVSAVSAWVGERPRCGGRVVRRPTSA